MGSTLSSFALGAAWFGSGLALFVFWSAAESWLRATLPGFSTSLDAVRAGRLGPRAGTAILAGWGLGSGLAGMQLLFFSLAALSGSVHPKQWSVATEAFGGASAFARAPLQAGLVVLAIAAARRLSSARFAPALAVADVGIAMGSGTGIAMHTASLTLLRGNLRSLVSAIKLSRITLRNIRQNLAFAFAYNLIGIPLAAGVLYPLNGWLLDPMFAGAAMSVSSVCVVLNSLRLRWLRL